MFTVIPGGIRFDGEDGNHLEFKLEVDPGNAELGRITATGVVAGAEYANSIQVSAQPTANSTLRFGVSSPPWGLNALVIEDGTQVYPAP